ncbi:MAG: leucine-rich repeat domain-containing protein [Mycoplasmataceae bacterium]|nr:leucine-rich repeat domain-containing protein [Mycoplasmataceae bacterium]
MPNSVDTVYSNIIPTSYLKVNNQGVLEGFISDDIDLSAYDTLLIPKQSSTDIDILKIDSGAFAAHFSEAYSPTIKNIIVSSGSLLEEVGVDAFVSCDSLTSVDFTNAEHLNLIDGAAFQDCTSLNSLGLDANLNNISQQAFENCYVLSNVFSYAHMSPTFDTSLGANSFKNTPPKNLYIPNGAINYVPWVTFANATLLDLISPCSGENFMNNQLTINSHESWTSDTPYTFNALNNPQFQWRCVSEPSWVWVDTIGNMHISSAVYDENPYVFYVRAAISNTTFAQIQFSLTVKKSATPTSDNNYIIGIAIAVALFILLSIACTIIYFAHDRKNKHKGKK